MGGEQHPPTTATPKPIMLTKPKPIEQPIEKKTLFSMGFSAIITPQGHRIPKPLPLDQGRYQSKFTQK
jgi:hypothetical protein